MISDHSDPLASLGGEESGGQNVYVNALASQLAHKGHTVHVLTRLNNPADPTEETAESGYTVFRAPVGPSGFIPKEEFALHLDAFAEAALARAAVGSYDIIHSHYWLSGVTGVRIRQSYAIPLVHTFHSLGKVKHATLRGIDPSHKRQRERAEMSIVQHADCLLTESPDERSNLIRLYRADPSRITVVPAGVDTTLFHPRSKQKARAELGIRHQHVLLYVGRFVAQKGLPTLLKAFARLRASLLPEEREDVLLLLVGGDLTKRTKKQSAIQQKLQNIINELALGSSVRIVGKVPNEELPTYYQAADFCVIPSRYEPFGIVPLEAMACGKPVVASFVGGMKSTVRNLYTGFHARPNADDDFAQKMKHLLSNASLCKEFGQHGRRRTVAEYSWDSISERVLSCYNATVTHV